MISCVKISQALRSTLNWIKNSRNKKRSSMNAKWLRNSLLKQRSQCIVSVPQTDPTNIDGWVCRHCSRLDVKIHLTATRSYQTLLWRWSWNGREAEIRRTSWMLIDLTAQAPCCSQDSDKYILNPHKARWIIRSCVPISPFNRWSIQLRLVLLPALHPTWQVRLQQLAQSSLLM